MPQTGGELAFFFAHRCAVHFEHSGAAPSGPSLDHVGGDLVLLVGDHEAVAESFGRGLCAFDTGGGHDLLDVTPTGFSLEGPEQLPGGRRIGLSPLEIVDIIEFLQVAGGEGNEAVGFLSTLEGLELHRSFSVVDVSYLNGEGF